jgi:hypothetical protein
MRKTILAGTIAAAAAISTAASAQPNNYPANYYAPAAGVVAGTVVGLGFAENWWGTPAGLATVGGGVATGLVAGIGTIALIDAFTTPCHGFRIAVDSPAACAGMNARAEAIGPAPRRSARRHR